MNPLVIRIHSRNSNDSFSFTRPHHHIHISCIYIHDNADASSCTTTLLCKSFKELFLLYSPAKRCLPKADAKVRLFFELPNFSERKMKQNQKKIEKRKEETNCTLLYIRVWSGQTPLPCPPEKRKHAFFFSSIFPLIGNNETPLRPQNVKTSVQKYKQLSS